MPPFIFDQIPLQANIPWLMGDYGVNINFVLTDNAGNPFNLSGFTLTFKAQADNVSGLNFSGIMTIDTPASGQCHYTPASTDFSQLDQYQCQIVGVNSGTGTKITWFGIKAIVYSPLPAY